MAQLDYYVKLLFKDRRRFADLCNVEIFHGKRVLKPEGLYSLPVENGIVVTDDGKRKRTVQRRRDVVMSAEIGACFAIIGLEGQGEIHYAMPIRILTYDALAYVEQAGALEKGHKEKKDLKTGAEFLSGLSKADRLMPVITLVLYYGKKEWDGPRSVYEMLDMSGLEQLKEDIHPFLSDYRINVVNLREIEKPESYETGLQYVFGKVKYNKDKSKFYNYVKCHEAGINALSKEEIGAAIVLLGEENRLSRLMEEPKQKEDTAMCQAIDELIEDEKREGIETLNKNTDELGTYQMFLSFCVT